MLPGCDAEADVSLPCLKEPSWGEGMDSLQAVDDPKWKKPFLGSPDTDKEQQVEKKAIRMVRRLEAWGWDITSKWNFSFLFSVAVNGCLRKLYFHHFSS